MSVFAHLKLRTSVILLIVSTILVTLTIVGSGIVVVMIGRIGSQNQAQVAEAAADTAGRVEVFLQNLQARVELAGTLYRDLPPEALPTMLGRARTPTLSAIYVIDGGGRLVAASIDGLGEARTDELVGIDLAAYPFFRAAVDGGVPLWSDKHLSAVTGAVTLGLAAPIGRSGGAVIAELPLNTLLEISRVARGIGGLDYWIIDSKGEVISDTRPRENKRINLYNLPVVSAGFAGTDLPKAMTFDGTAYHVSASYSKILGWLFVTRIPAGLENPHVREIAAIVMAGFVSSVVVGLLLAPLWAQGIVRPLRIVAERADQIARGERPTDWPRGGIAEFDGLSADLETMARAIARREADLKHLNEELEERVARRTDQLNRSNLELTGALATVKQAQDELVQSERLAALGRLVAGVAHELNTPLGNGRMAVTTLIERLIRFESSVAGGLRRTELDAFINSVRTSTQIAEQNLMRASELIGSFKQVAADRAGSRRRKFELGEVIDEVLLTLTPMLKGMPISVQIQVPADLWLDSYPGALGQVLTNLIENSITHGFRDRDGGAIAIIAEQPDPSRVVVRLQDDGAGMPPEVARRAFDPFFTTALGQGGTGLGLFITLNAVTNVLGGRIEVNSQPDRGATFDVTIPLVAPEAAADDQSAALPAVSAPSG